MELDSTGNGDTLLDYSLDPDSEPLRVGRAVRLNLVASNSTDDRIDVSEILLALPVGQNASDLVAAGTQIEVAPPKHWQSMVDGGTIKLTPDSGKAAVERGSLTFTIAVALNGEAGSATVQLAETAASPDDPSRRRSVSFDMAKYPEDFTLGDLLTVPRDLKSVRHGKPVTLAWEGTGKGVQCTLSYVRDEWGNVVRKTVPLVGTMQSEPLTCKGTVTFVLLAEQNIVGQDNPLVLERRLDLRVESLDPEIWVEPPRVAPNGLVRLRWSAPLADYCVLDDGSRQQPDGVAYFVVSADREFTVSAYRGSDKVEKQMGVTIDSSIAPTEQGYSITGAQGVDGPPGADSSDDPEHTTDGHQGGAGGDARLQKSLPPLDTDGHARVIPIRLTGGKGGTGGAGGVWDWEGIPYEIRNSGPGGQGGRAVLDVTLDDKDAVPAQYIITLLPGPGGDGGPRQDGGSETRVRGGPGQTGPIGSVSATIDGKVVALPSEGA